MANFVKKRADQLKPGDYVFLPQYCASDRVKAVEVLPMAGVRVSFEFCPDWHYMASHPVRVEA